MRCCWQDGNYILTEYLGLLPSAHCGNCLLIGLARCLRRRGAWSVWSGADVALVINYGTLVGLIYAVAICGKDIDSAWQAADTRMYIHTYVHIWHAAVSETGRLAVSEAFGFVNLFVSIAATKVWRVLSKQLWWHMHKALTVTQTPSHIHLHTHRQTDGTKRCLGQHLVTKLFCFWSAFEIDAIVYLANLTSLSVRLPLSFSLPLSVRSTYKLFAAYQRVAVVHFYGHLLLFSPFLVTYPGPVGSPIGRGMGEGSCVACEAQQSPGIWRCWSDACVADFLCVCGWVSCLSLVCMCAHVTTNAQHTHIHPHEAHLSQPAERRTSLENCLSRFCQTVLTVFPRASLFVFTILSRKNGKAQRFVVGGGVWSEVEPISGQWTHRKHGQLSADITRRRGR